MRECGSCTLCCKLPAIVALEKPKNTWCKHCEIGVGCTIYESRPRDCSEFNCAWLLGDLPDDLKPNLVFAYATIMGEYAQIMVERGNEYKQVVEAVTDKGLHAIVNQGDSISFVCGKGKPRPKLLQLSWTL